MAEGAAFGRELRWAGLRLSVWCGCPGPSAEVGRAPAGSQLHRASPGEQRTLMCRVFCSPQFSSKASSSVSFSAIPPLPPPFVHILPPTAPWPIYYMDSGRSDSSDRDQVSCMLTAGLWAWCPACTNSCAPSLW